jgi:hypothetical protein
LTTSATVTCGHGGTIVTSGSAKFTVQSAGALLQAGIAPKSVGLPPCGTPVPPMANKKCLSATVVDPGSLASKLTVQALPVVIMPLTGTTDGVVGGTPQKLLSAIAATVQAKLTTL